MDAATGYQALPSPQRILDTRPGTTTADGSFQGIGIRPAGSTLELDVSGRLGVPADAVAVVLNVTSNGSQTPGFATVFPCGVSRPNASNLNYATAQTIPNAAVATIGSNGRVCIYTQSTAHYIVDVSGYFATGAYEGLSAPQRLLDTRSGEKTADGQFQGIGIRPAGSTLRLDVAGRAGIPSTASAVILNITVIQAQQQGYTTVFPRGVNRPNASNLNYRIGQTIPNLVVAKLGVGGDICLFTLGTAHYAVDVAGWLTSPRSTRRTVRCRIQFGDGHWGPALEQDHAAKMCPSSTN